MPRPSGIDAAIDDILPVLRKKPDQSLLGVMLACRHADGERARQHQARDLAAVRTSRATRSPARVWALLTHPEQLQLVRKRRGHVAPGVRGICALDLADRHVAAAHRKAVVDPRRRVRAGGAHLPDVRLGQSRREAF